MARTCLFCNVTLTGTTRAKEHIIPNSWLRRLGHSKLNIESISWSPTTGPKTRFIAADQMQAGLVCKKCNNGWMRYLDEQVRETILSLATHKNKLANPQDLDKCMRKLMARWLLKTACVHEYADEAHRRHITTDIRRRMRRADFLPPGLIFFASQTNSPLKLLATSSLDAWDPISREALEGTAQSQRIKFAIQLDGAVFGMCWINKPKPIFILPFDHFPLHASCIGGIYPRTGSADISNLPTETHRHVLMRYLADIGVAFDSDGLRKHGSMDVISSLN